MATNVRSVWVKVWPSRPFSGGSTGDPVQLSPTPIGDPVQLFREPAQLLHPALTPKLGALWVPKGLLKTGSLPPVPKRKDTSLFAQFSVLTFYLALTHNLTLS